MKGHLHTCKEIMGTFQAKVALKASPCNGHSTVMLSWNRILIFMVSRIFQIKHFPLLCNTSSTHIHYWYTACLNFWICLLLCQWLYTSFRHFKLICTKLGSHLQLWRHADTKLLIPTSFRRDEMRDCWWVQSVPWRCQTPPRRSDGRNERQTFQSWWT